MPRPAPRWCIFPQFPGRCPPGAPGRPIERSIFCVGPRIRIAFHGLSLAPRAVPPLPADGSARTCRAAMPTKRRQGRVGGVARCDFSSPSRDLVPAAPQSCRRAWLLCRAVCPDGGSAMGSLAEEFAERCIHVCMHLCLLMKVPFRTGCGVHTCGFWGARIHDEQEGPKVRFCAVHDSRRRSFSRGRFLEHPPHFARRTCCGLAHTSTS